MPGVQGLMGVEAIAVPFINSRGASFGAVGNDEERLSVHMEDFHVIWLSYFQNVDVLDFDEFVCRDVSLEDVRAAEQLCHYNEELTVND